MIKFTQLSAIYTLLKSLGFYLSAKTIYRIHSPYAYELISSLLDDRIFYSFHKIERIRYTLLNSKEQVDFKELGAKSNSAQIQQRRVSDIAKKSLSRKWQCQVMFKLLVKLKAERVIEIGSSLGVSTAYLATACRGMVYSLEGNQASIDIAKNIAARCQLKNIDFIEGHFDDTLAPLLNRIDKVDACFIDGNHKKKATIKYTSLIMKKSHQNTILIIDDIYWSKGMTEAWREIQQMDQVTMTLDFFHFGMVILNSDIKERQHIKVIPSKFKPWQKFI